jgi:hypothetical protein
MNLDLSGSNDARNYVLCCPHAKKMTDGCLPFLHLENKVSSTLATLGIADKKRGRHFSDPQGGKHRSTNDATGAKH